MLVLGLTGGIGMGKSVAAKIMRSFGLPVYDADKAVHKLLKKGGKAVRPVGIVFPKALKRAAIDRKILGELVFQNPGKLKKLESVLHPLVHTEEQSFLARARRKKVVAAVLEIPLLFETGAHQRCDKVLCVTVPKALQRARVMERPGMTEARYQAILKRQMKDSERRRKADYIIETSKSYADTKRQLARVLKSLGLISSQPYSS